MRLMDSLFRRRLNPAWSFSPGGTIWRILISQNGTIVGESRDESAKRLEIFGINARTGKELWRCTSLPDAWWVGLNRIHEQTFFLHGYEKPDMPTHRGIWAFDVATGKALWNDPDASLWSVTEGRACTMVEGIDHRNVSVRNARTGGEVRAVEPSPEELKVLRDKSAAEEIPESVVLPTLLDAVELAPAVREIVDSYLSRHNVSGDVDAVRRGNRIALGFYHTSPGGGEDSSQRECMLSVVDVENGKCVHEAVLVQSAHGMAPPSFFVCGNLLLYIIEGRQLVAVNAWS